MKINMYLQNAITVQIDLLFFSLQNNWHYKLDQLGRINSSIEPGWKIGSILIVFHDFYPLAFVLVYHLIVSMTEEKGTILRWTHKLLKGSKVIWYKMVSFNLWETLWAGGLIFQGKYSFFHFLWTRYFFLEWQS